jgi:hypothetical protein
VNPVLIYSLSVSVDGVITDREGVFGWSAGSDELFGLHLALVSALGGELCGRGLDETMLVWGTDPSLRDSQLGAAFADVWCAIPKVVFRRTLDSVRGNARLVDELRMFRHPVVVGGGTPFLPPVTADVPLDLVETRTFGSRVIDERYGRARDESH